MNLADRIEKRLFVGRELLLWLWFESELFEATGLAGPLPWTTATGRH